MKVFFLEVEKMKISRVGRNFTGKNPFVELGLKKQKFAVYDRMKNESYNVKVVERLGKQPLHIFISEVLANFFTVYYINLVKMRVRLFV